MTMEIIENLTAKSFGLTGDTFPHRDKLKEMHGVWSPKHQAWCFSNWRIAMIRDFIAKAILNAAPVVAPSLQKTELEAIVTSVDRPPRIIDLTKAEPMSAKHLAMQHLLAGGGIRPEDIRIYNGTFGRDRHGIAFGQAEQQSMIWMLNRKQRPVDQLAMDLCQDYPGIFNKEAVQDALLECATEFAGPGGKQRMMAECKSMESLEFQFPF